MDKPPPCEKCGADAHYKVKAFGHVSDFCDECTMILTEIEEANAFIYGFV